MYIYVYIYVGIFFSSVLFCQVLYPNMPTPSHISYTSHHYIKIHSKLCRLFLGVKQPQGSFCPPIYRVSQKKRSLGIFGP